MEGRVHPVGVVILMLAVIGGGSFVLQREVADTILTALILSVAWAGAVGLAFLLYGRSRGILRPVLAGLVVGAVGAGVAFYLFAIADDVVDEDVVIAQPPAAAGTGGTPGSGNVAIAAGNFAGADGHSGTGKATVIEQPGGERTLTFTDFDVSRGVAVEVWLTPGPDEADDRIELGALKGNVGDQQYEVPEGADLSRYRTVVLYCTPFTVRIAVAELGVV